jgi:DNA polymerase-3 subunit delta
VKPDQFLLDVQRRKLATAYLFLGQEPYRREICRNALIDGALPPEEKENGLVRHDLEQIGLSSVLDDARSLSLFAPRRLIWVSSAEAALPRTRAGHDSDGGAPEQLAGYLKNPTPGVIVVFEASRFDLEGDDALKAERVRKFYSSVPAQVEFSRFSVQDARRLARELARAHGLNIDLAVIDSLVESLDADGLRIATEIQKLHLYAGEGATIREEDLATLVPDSSASTIFALVDALGRRDRLRALAVLDTLLRQGEYLPLGLTFLATLFRLALAAKEMGLRNTHQIQRQLSRPGKPVWRSRAEQISQTASTFSKEELETVLERIFVADRALRDARPDDRIVVENFIMRL